MIVCQIGAREHYALAAELAGRDALTALATDVWAGPGTLAGAVGRAGGLRTARLAERTHPALARAPVLQCGLAPALAQAMRERAAGLRGWRAIMARNRWFGRRIAAAIARERLLERASPSAVFAYSYAALEILRAARAAGAPAILGQIDPGPVEDIIVAEVAARHGLASDGRERPPTAYWSLWREECTLADAIVVNSEWSAEALARAGVALEKVRVVPLGIDIGGRPVPAPPDLPERFGAARPLRLLFLGQVNVRKGAVELCEAMARLARAPVTLTLVGPVQEDLAARYAGTPDTVFVGPVPRGAVAAHYRSADVMVLPTHSDGFALTQLEAQAAGLPVITSRRCGRVVTDGVDGLVLPEVSAAAVEAAVRTLLTAPERIAAMSARASRTAAAFTPARTAEAVAGIAEEVRRTRRHLSRGNGSV